MEWAGHCTGSWEQQSSSSPCTPYSNEISQEISQKLPVGMAFRPKDPNFAIFFSLEKGQISRFFSQNTGLGQLFAPFLCLF
jgi:hypothetical protein